MSRLRPLPALAVGVLAVAAVGAGLLVAAGDAAGPGPGPPLSWAPPTGWEDYARHTIGPEGGRIDLDDGEDHLLVAPETVAGPVEIVGGRDVVWIGGHVTVAPPASTVGHGARRGLVIRDDGGEQAGRTVHVEGLLIDGDGLAEGIDVDAPTADVQLQRIHVDTVRFLGADDRDGTGPFDGLGRNHPDVLQTYGGQRSLRVDGLTGSTAYQGVFLKEDHPDAPAGPMTLRNVDIDGVAIEGTDGFAYAANRLLFVHDPSTGPLRLDDVWLDVHPDAGKVDDDLNPREGSGGTWRGAFRDGDRLVAEPPPGTAGAGDAVELWTPEGRVLATVTTTDDGVVLGWPDRPDRILDADGDGPGVVRAGEPPVGDFVPRDEVGIDYRSPGYD